ncbi:MAG: histidine kinase N-terminal 7TM domain-containing protein [Acidobacteriaceae bacterium]
MSEYFTSHIGTHLWFPLFVAACMEGVAVYAWPYRKEVGARPLIYMQLYKGTWLLSMVLASQSTQMQPFIFWMVGYQVASLLLLFFWFQFVAQLSGFAQEGPAWVSYLMGGTVGILCLLSVTSDWTGWIWRPFWTNGSNIGFIDGPMGSWTAWAAHLMGLFTLSLCVRWVLRSTGLRRGQAWVVLLSSLSSFAGYLLSVHYRSSSLAPIPLGFLVSSLLTAWAFFHWRMFSIVPLAQEVVVKSMIDGLIVVDGADCIVEMNATARAIFKGLPVAQGSTFAGVVAAWPELADFCAPGVAPTLEVGREVHGSWGFFHAMQTPLRTPAGHLLGRVLVFKDVTLEKQQQARIVEQEKALSMLAERQRVGRELHDGQGQIWSFLSMQAQAARALIAKQDFEQADRSLGRLLAVVQGEHVGLRESITGLQASVSGKHGLLQVLEEQLRWYREHCDLQAELVLRCEWQAGVLAPSVEVQLLSILHEALANVRKSAKASRVQVIITQEGRNLMVLVEDDGCGFDVAHSSQQTGHYGLKIMRERADEIGAQLTIGPNPGGGTRVRLQIPISAAAEAPG